MSIIRLHGPVSTYGESSYLRRPERLFPGAGLKFNLGKTKVRELGREAQALHRNCELLAGTQPLPATAPETLSDDINGIKKVVAKIDREFYKLAKVFSSKSASTNIERTTRKIIHDLNNHLSIVISNSTFIIDDLGVPHENSGTIIDLCRTIKKSGETITRGLKELYEIMVAKPRETAEKLKPNKVPPQTILVVDDDPANRSLIERILTGQGHTVALAASAEESLTFILTGFSLIITDIDMDEMDGLTLAGKIRALHGEAIRIIIMSGLLNPTRRSIAEGHGVKFCLEKPLTANTLTAAIAKAFSEK